MEGVLDGVAVLGWIVGLYVCCGAMLGSKVLGDLVSWTSEQPFLMHTSIQNYKVFTAGGSEGCVVGLDVDGVELGENVGQTSLQLVWQVSRIIISEILASYSRNSPVIYALESVCFEIKTRSDPAFFTTQRFPNEELPNLKSIKYTHFSANVSLRKTPSYSIQQTYESVVESLRKYE